MSNLIIDLAPLPSRDDPDNLDPNADQMFGKLGQFRTDLIAYAAMMNRLGGGTAFSLVYTFAAATADADPGPGLLRLDNATQNAATTIRLDSLGEDTLDNSAIIDAFDDSTSVIKGQIELACATDPRKRVVFNVLSVAGTGGYRNVGVTPISGSSAAPFAAGDLLLLKFTRTGDLGGTAVAPLLHLRDEKTSGQAAGGSAAGIQTRAIGTIKKNSIAAGIAGNQFTLPAGTYRLRGNAPGFGTGNTHQAYLYNVTDATYDIIGTSELASASAMTRSRFEGEVIIPVGVSKTFEVRHFTAATVTTNGLGTPASSGKSEVYSEIYVEKVA